MPLTAWMSENESLGGWPMGFFTIGVIEATVPVLFFFFITASPQDSRFVSEYEKRYIAKENSGSVGSKSDVSNDRKSTNFDVSNVLKCVGFR